MCRGMYEWEAKVVAVVLCENRESESEVSRDSDVRESEVRESET